MEVLRPHPEQNRLIRSSARFKIIVAGRRSGKTEITKRRLIKALFDCHPLSRDFRPLAYNGLKWDNPHFFAAGPTRDQAKTIWWADLKKMIHPDYIEEIRESSLSIVTKWGAMLSVIGLDRPERMEGTPWDGGAVDEFANVKETAWMANIFPALSERNAWCWLLGVPDVEAPGQIQYKRFVDNIKAKDPKFANWDVFSWPSSDVLDPEQVEIARQTMDPELYAQEYGGKFVLAGGLCFPTFDIKEHVDTYQTEARYDYLLPLCLSFDFNVNPFCFGVLQHYKPEKVYTGSPKKAIRPRVIHEFRLTDSDTNVACNAFLDWYEALPQKPPSLYVYGDPSGSARDSTSGQTDWTLIAKHLKNLQPRFQVPSAHSPIKDTVNSVRARLKNAAGDVGLIINPQARELIKNFQEALWPTDLEPQHSLAWLRYFCDQEYPITVEAPAIDGNTARFLAQGQSRTRTDRSAIINGPSRHVSSSPRAIGR